MTFFENPILNSPYRMPGEHWELDNDGRPTDEIIEKHRRSDLISALPKSKSQSKAQQDELDLNNTGLDGMDIAAMTR